MFQMKTLTISGVIDLAYSMTSETINGFLEFKLQNLRFDVFFSKKFQGASLIKLMSQDIINRKGKTKNLKKFDQNVSCQPKVSQFEFFIFSNVRIFMLVSGALIKVMKNWIAKYLISNRIKSEQKTAHSEIKSILHP